jgi:hypothetical protein
MGRAHLESGDLDQAVDELLAAVRSLPGDPEVAAALEEALERFTEPRIEVEPLPEEAAAEPEVPEEAPFTPFLEEPGAGLADPIVSTMEGASGCAAPPATRAQAVDLGLVRELTRPRGVPVETRPHTILLRGVRGSASRLRRTGGWVGAFFVAGALALGAVVLTRTGASPGSSRPQGGLPSPPDGASRTLAAAVPVEVGREEVVAAREDTPDHGAAPVGRKSSSPAEVGERDPAATAAEEAETAALAEAATVSGDEASPRYDFMSRVGLLAPPGATLDPDNSDARRLVREGLPVAGGRPLVLTFRTGVGVQEVVEFYRVRDARMRFNWRVVPMGGKFQGVERKLARARGRVAGGHEATLTVSWPGVDLASKALVPETTVRIVIF